MRLEFILNNKPIKFTEIEMSYIYGESHHIVLATGLPAHFRHVTVEVVDCPDLRQAPFHLAAEGLSGSPAIVDIGGPPFLLPLVDRTKIYDLREIGQRIQPDGTDILAIGAGAGYYPMLNCNTEVCI